MEALVQTLYKLLLYLAQSLSNKSLLYRWSYLNWVLCNPHNLCIWCPRQFISHRTIQLDPVLPFSKICHLLMTCDLLDNPGKFLRALGSTYCCIQSVHSPYHLLIELNKLDNMSKVLLETVSTCYYILA